MATLIRSGTVCLADGPAVCDLLVEDGRIARIAKVGEIDPAEDPGSVVDASGLVVLPGLIDCHVHLEDRIGRFTIADDFQSGTAAALCSGVTTVVNFITQQSGETLEGALRKGVYRGLGASHCDFSFHLTPTSFSETDWAGIEAIAARGLRTFKFYTTYREAGLYTDYAALGAIMGRLADLGCRVLVHCEDEKVLEAVDASGLDLTSAGSWALLRPAEAEVVAIGKVLDLAAKTGAKVHIVHVSTSAGAELIDGARGRVDVTCETAPQYILLDESILDGPGGHRHKCTPPPRSGKVREAMEGMAVKGLFDLYATDHCPFVRTDKDDFTDITTVPSGIAGVGALVPLMHGLLVKKHGLGWPELVLRLSENPARLAGLFPRKGTIRAGSDADLVIIDADAPERSVASSFADCYDTYRDRTTAVAFKYVFLRGALVVREGRLVTPDRPKGGSTWLY